MQGAGFPVGLVYWPGGTIEDWGPPDTGLNPCNETVQANLVRVCLCAGAPCTAAAACPERPAAHAAA
jgi:hypothetical protein